MRPQSRSYHAVIGYRADVASRDHGEAVEAEEPATKDETSRIKDLIAALGG
jgi:hypothetical protein